MFKTRWGGIGHIFSNQCQQVVAGRYQCFVRFITSPHATAMCDCSVRPLKRRTSHLCDASDVRNVTSSRTAMLFCLRLHLNGVQGAGCCDRKTVIWKSRGAEQIEKDVTTRDQPRSPPWSVLSRVKSFHKKEINFGQCLKKKEKTLSAFIFSERTNPHLKF